MSGSVPSENVAGPGTSRVSRYLWVLVPLVFAGMMSQSLISYGLPVLYPFIQNEFNLSRAQVGFITSVYAIGFGGAVMLAGWLADSFGLKRMFIISLVALALLTLAFPLAYSFPVVLALVLIIGIISSPIYPSTTRAVIDWFPVRVRALAMGFAQAGFPVAGALTAALLPAIALMAGWRMAAAATGLFVLAVAVLFLLLYRDAPRSGEAAYKFNFAAIKRILRSRPLVIALVWGSSFSGLQYTVLTYFMLFMIEELHISALMAGGLLAIAQISSSLCRVLWGVVSDFTFRGRRIPALAAIGFLTVIWMAGASLTTAGVPAVALYGIAIGIGLSTVSFHGVFSTFIGELADRGQIGMTVGFSSLTMRISQTLMPPLFGFLVDTTASYSLAWAVAAAVALAGTLTLLTFGREPRHT